PILLPGMKLILTIAAIVSLIGLILIIKRGEAVGISVFYISRTRNVVIGEGGGPLFIILQVYKAAVLLAFFFTLGIPNKKVIPLFFHSVLVCTLDLLMGSRAPLIFSFILPLLLGFHYLWQRISLYKLIAPIFLLVVVLSPIYRSITRDA